MTQLQFGYYPGCALHGSSCDYEQSLRAVLDVLGVKLEELNDWICCGASAAHALNHKLGVALPARNLAIAERDGVTELFAPCPMCSMELLKARDAIMSDETLRDEMSQTVELPLTGNVAIRNLIEVFMQIGQKALSAKITKPQTTLKPVCYYGCLLTRPSKVVKFDDPEHPTTMEEFCRLCGAEPLDWNARTMCCGAGLTMADADTVKTLSGRIISEAVRVGANCVIVACPMCHMNLDLNAAPSLLVLYLSDLIGLAMGLTASQLGINRHFSKVEAK